MMKIVFDNIIFSLQKAGGISVVWKELISRFIESNKDDILFIEHDSDLENYFRKQIIIPDDKIILAKNRFLQIERYINPRVKRSDPFIFHSSYFRTCPSKNAINVTTVHDFTYDYFFKGKRRGAFVHLWQRNNALRNSAAIICISENTKKDLLKLVPEIDPHKVYVIYNGVSEDYHQTDDKIVDYSDYLLYVGGRISYKNARWFAEAIKDTNHKLLFCGAPMTSDERAYYDSMLGTERYLELAHPTNEELNRIYNSVKCLVYPSSYEGFGIPVLEAQRAGCPVIALNTSSIPEVIGETPLLMKELTKEELMSKISLLDNEETRGKVIDMGLENAKRFTWDNTYVQYRRLYERLLSDQ